MRRRRLFLLSVLLLLAPAGGVHGSGSASPTRHTLPNGLRVLLKPNPGSDIVAFELLIRADAASEPKDLAGLRQLTQQMLLRGTQLHSGDEIANEIESLGATLDISVGLDYVEVYTIAPASAFNPVCRYLGEIVSRPLFDTGQLEIQRQAAIQFSRGLEDDPFQVAYLLMRQTLYGEHPYGRSPAGDPESLAGITRQQVLDHYQAYYRPGNAVLAITGNVASASALATAQEAFSSWQAATVSSPSPFATLRSSLLRSTSAPRPSPLPLSRLAVREKAVRVSYQVLGFLAPGIGEEDYFPLQVANVVLGGGMSSRLFTELRGRRGLVYEIGSFYPTLSAASHFAVNAVSQTPDFREVSQALIGEVRRLREQTLSDEELSRAKQYLIGSYALAHQRNKEQAYYLAWYELLGVGYQFDERYPQRIAAVTAADVRRAAQKYFTRYAQALLVPSGSFVQSAAEARPRGPIAETGPGAARSDSETE